MPDHPDGPPTGEVIVEQPSTLDTGARLVIRRGPAVDAPPPEAAPAKPAAPAPISEELRAYGAVGQVRDPGGRALFFRKLGYSARMKAARVLGAEGALNAVLFSNALVAFACAGIGEDGVAMPETPGELDALWDRLGDRGVNTLAVAMNREGGPEDVAVAKK